MGIGGISIGSLLLILVIVMVIFGTKRIRNIGEDLGSAMRSFRKGLREDEKISGSVESSQNSAKANKTADKSKTKT